MKIFSSYILCLLVIFSINACNNNSRPDIDTSLINISAPKTTPANSTSLLDTVSVTPATANNSSTVALNPPHGHPGHDCAIPVGSPLNGKSKVAPQSPVPPATPALMDPSQKLPFSNSVALNPPHGQPGHDCAIPVGQPL
jgi:hypothetical protein